MKKVTKMPSKSSYGNREITVTFNRDSELEKKIATMKIWGYTSDAYEKSMREIKEEFKKYDNIKGIEFAYRGTEIESIVPYQSRKDYIQSVVGDLDFLDVCFNCDHPMVKHKAYDWAHDMFNDWDEDEEKVENKKRITHLIQNSAYVQLWDRDHVITHTKLESHCPNCGNTAQIKMKLEPVHIIDYDIEENRAEIESTRGPLVYNKTKDEVRRQRDLFEKIGQDEEQVLYGQDSEKYAEMLEMLNKQWTYKMHRIIEEVAGPQNAAGDTQ